MAECFEYLVKKFLGQEDKTDFLGIFQKQYNTTAKDIGIYGQSADRRTKDGERLQECRQKHLPTIMRGKIRDNIRSDIKAKRFEYPSHLSHQKFVQLVYSNALIQLEKQNGRCAYSTIGLTIENSWKRFSFERLNNSLPHFTQSGQVTNCVLVCRIFNTIRQLSYKLILQYLLTQKMVEVPDCVRKQVENILNGKSKKRKIIEIIDEPLLSN